MISREYPTKINKKFLNYNDYLKQTQKLLPRNYKFQFYLKTIIVFMNISSNHILDGVIKYFKKKKKCWNVIGIQWLYSHKWKPLQDIDASHCLQSSVTVLTATLFEALKKKKKRKKKTIQFMKDYLKRPYETWLSRRWQALQHNSITNLLWPAQANLLITVFKIKLLLFQ